MRSDDTRLASADEASRLSLEQSADDPSRLDTRGHVLLWAGRHADAENYLLRAHKLAKVDSTRGASAAGLAMLCHRQNRIDDAKAWLARAKQYGCEQLLLARTVAEVEPLVR